MTDRHLPPDDEADLAALADDRLDPERRARLEERLRSDPALAARLERQREAVSVIASAVGDTSAPFALRERLSRGEQAAPARRRRLRRWLAPAAAVLAATVAAVAITVSDGLTVEETLAAARRPPAFAATPDPTEPALLRDRVDGVRFPNFAAKFGWRPAGVRTDEIGGRKTRTVFYRKGERTVAYTVVDGDPLDESGRAGQYEGIDVRTFAADGRRVVTWERNGRTCILSGTGVGTETLLDLATWKGKGSVEF